MNREQRRRLLELLPPACNHRHIELEKFLESGFEDAVFPVNRNIPFQDVVFDFVQFIERFNGLEPQVALALQSHFPNAIELVQVAREILLEDPLARLAQALDRAADPVALARFAAEYFEELRPRYDTGDFEQTPVGYAARLAKREDGMAKVKFAPLFQYVWRLRQETTALGSATASALDRWLHETAERVTRTQADNEALLAAATALRKRNHASTILKAAEDIFGGANVALTAREALVAASQSVERQIKGDPSLQALVVGIPGLPYDVGGQDERWWRAKAAVARVESPDGIPCASGFLVGPDLLLTNDHVRMEARFDANPKAVLIRFGYSRTDAVAERGQAVGLDEHWLLASSPVNELDYCLVRLSSAVGEQPVGRDLGAPKRGWLAPSADAAKIGDIITVLGHPKEETLMQAAGVVKNSGADGWLDYSAHTLPGSSGSPVLNARFELVGLHSREGTTVSNRGATLAAILRHLEKDKPLIWNLVVTAPS